MSLLPTILRVRACAQRSSQVSAEVGDRVLELRISHSRQDAANVNPIMTKRVSFLQVILMHLRYLEYISYTCSFKMEDLIILARHEVTDFPMKR